MLSFSSNYSAPIIHTYPGKFWIQNTRTISNFFTVSHLKLLQHPRLVTCMGHGHKYFKKVNFSVSKIISLILNPWYGNTITHLTPQHTRRNPFDTFLPWPRLKKLIKFSKCFYWREGKNSGLWARMKAKSTKAEQTAKKRPEIYKLPIPGKVNCLRSGALQMFTNRLRSFTTITV